MNDLVSGSSYTLGDIDETIAKLRSLADDLEAVTKGIAPAVPAVAISEWMLGRRAVPCLVGLVRDHPVVKGKAIATTEVYFVHQAAGLARTLNRWYRLEGPIAADDGPH